MSWLPNRHGSVRKLTRSRGRVSDLLVNDSVTVAVQVNGKLRATLDLARDAEGPTLEAKILALPGVVRAMDGKTARKVIVIPNKVVNVVI